MTPLQFVVAAAIRWGGLVALAALMGGVALDLLVLPAGAPESDAMRRHLRWWHLIALVVLLLAAVGELGVRVQTMSGGPLAAAIPAVPLVLTRTHFGTIWIARMTALGLLLLLAFLPWPGARGLSALLALGVTLTTSLTGHAADWGDVSLRVFADWAHVLASTVWTGGLGALALVVLGRRTMLPPPLVAAIARRFSRLAGVCLLVVVGSGAYNAWTQVGAWSPLWTTTYGRVLLAKLAIALGLVALGAANRYAIIPRLDPRHPSRGIGVRLFRRARLALCGLSRTGRSALPSRLSANVAREAALAAMIFACTAALGETAPARHAIHAAHLAAAAAEPGPVRITMSELHESGGVPKGWLFTPPPGDPARGRRVFARLECYRCHAVQGEDFPAPSGAGPDLTGMGEHHPAGYLAESILNPNAVIVERPGYTGPDGLSTMPDYRNSLGVGDLIDLVAYLRSR
jgi:putative copper export protein